MAINRENDSYEMVALKHSCLAVPTILSPLCLRRARLCLVVWSFARLDPKSSASASRPVVSVRLVVRRPVCRAPACVWLWCYGCVCGGRGRGCLVVGVVVVVVVG